MRHIVLPVPFDDQVREVTFSLTRLDGQRYRPEITLPSGMVLTFNAPPFPLASWAAVIGAGAKLFVEENDLSEFYGVNWSDGPIVLLKQPMPRPMFRRYRGL